MIKNDKNKTNNAQKNSAIFPTGKRSGNDFSKDQSEKCSPSKPFIISLLLLIILTAAAYSPVFHAGFIWDDDDTIVNNTLLRSTSGLYKIWTDPSSISKRESGFWPLVYTLFWIQYRIWGDSPAGYHIVNLLFHIANVLLIFYLLRGAGMKIAFLSAGIFALHPVHVESVAWVTELKDVSSAFFYLLAFMIYIRNYKKEKLIAPLLSITLFLFAMLCKSITATFPAALLIYHWWKDGKITRRDLIRTLPFFIISFALSLSGILLEKQQRGYQYDFLFIEKILIAGRAFWFYMQKLFFPANLTIIYQKWDYSYTNPLLYIFPILIAALFILLWSKKNNWGKTPFALVLFYLLTLSPILGLISFPAFAYTFAADRYQYLASIGPIVLFAYLLAAFSDKYFKKQNLFLYILSGIILCVFAALTFFQAVKYKNLETIFTDNLKKNPDSWIAYNNIGDCFLERKEIDKGIEYYSEALKKNPDYFYALNNMGIALGKKEKFREAIPFHQKAIENKPSYTHAYYGLAVAYKNLGDIGNAIQAYKKALELSPNDPDIANNLAWIYATNPDAAFRNGKEAIRLAQTAVLYSDKNKEFYLDTLSAAYAENGQYDNAIKTALDAITIARQQNNELFIDEINSRIESYYKLNKPYRENKKN